MKHINEWLTEHDHNTEDVQKDSQGGIVPQKMKAAKRADLITLPENVEGTNCFNCRYVKKLKKGVGHCTHPKVDQCVNDRNCCAFWDNKGVHRPWEHKS